MKRAFILLCLVLGLGILQEMLAFCGFYVAKADMTLYNKYSQVILVRDGNHTSITMSNDFQGDVKDFAMVVPVPVILREDQIRVADRGLFDRLDAYTTPRMVEYYDPTPCREYYPVGNIKSGTATTSRSGGGGMGRSREDIQRPLGVTVEATYSVGEYDIVILSAEESGGLEIWLTENGYKIPKGAKEVLDPYIRSGMKFFVVKVNLEKQAASGFQTLRPLQISFDSPKFMLPIRLGMANAKSDQDLIVYSFTRNGRVEASNYRNQKMPTDKEIPEPVQQKFGQFYADLFTRNWKDQGRNAVYLEYAWDISGSNPVKCDPCPVNPPYLADLNEAGVNWVSSNGAGGYSGSCFVTRMHIRYNRSTFPQDLMFQETPNKERYQCRYILYRMASGMLDCSEGRTYLRTLVERRRARVATLVSLTGWSASDYQEYIDEITRRITGGTPGPKPSPQPAPPPGAVRSAMPVPAPAPAGTPVSADTAPVTSPQDSPQVTSAHVQDDTLQGESWSSPSPKEETRDGGIWKMAALVLAGLCAGLLLNRFRKPSGPPDPPRPQT